MGVLAVVTPFDIVVLNLIIHGKENIIYIVLIITTMCLNLIDRHDLYFIISHQKYVFKFC